MGVGTTCRTRLVTGQSPNPRRWLSPRFRLKQPAPVPLFDRYEANYGTGLSSMLSAATRPPATDRPVGDSTVLTCPVDQACGRLALLTPKQQACRHYER